jgi:ABC-type phosphate/phosphonate transport system substrate-binding protein
MTFPEKNSSTSGYQFLAERLEEKGQQEQDFAFFGANCEHQTIYAAVQLPGAIRQKKKGNRNRC